MIRGEVLTDASEVVHLTDDWARLARANARPFCNPEWMLEWWANVAPAGAQLRAIAISENDRLVGLAPLYSDVARGGSIRYRFLATGTSLRGDVLAVPGREKEIAGVIAGALRRADETPARLVLEGVAATSAWPRLLCDEWPTRHASKLVREWSIEAPVLSLQGRSFEQWFSGKSANFRQQMRRGRAQLEKQGAEFRMSASEDDLRSDLRAFASLHRARWEDRGGSRVLTGAVETMLFEAGRRMLADGRFRLWSLQVDDHIVSSHLFVAAGGEVSYWLGGFDERWAAQKPSMQVLLAALEDAWARGDARVDLGGGGQDYKYRLTDEHESLDWVSVIPPGWRRPFTRLSLATVRARRAALARMSPRLQARVRKLAGRG